MIINYQEKEFPSKLVHSGYFSNIYYFNDGDASYLAKFFLNKENSNPLEPISTNEMFSRELAGLGRLDNIKSSLVITPKLVYINKDQLFYIQECFNFTKFNNFLLKNFNFFNNKNKIKDVFYNLGGYLSALHNQSKVNDDLCYCHGDLNNKNVGFMNDKIFIFDPSIYEFQYRNSPYYDLARFLFNLYPYNIFYNLFLVRRYPLILSFLTGYFENSTSKFSGQKLNIFIRSRLEDIKKYSMAKDPLSWLKRLYILLWSYIIIAALKRNIDRISF